MCLAALEKLATYTLADILDIYENIEEFLNFVLYYQQSIMRARKSSQSNKTDASHTSDLAGDCDSDDTDMMCLVYPDGRTKTISTQQDQSED